MRRALRNGAWASKVRSAAPRGPARRGCDRWMMRGLSESPECGFAHRCHQTCTRRIHKTENARIAMHTTLDGTSVSHALVCLMPRDLHQKEQAQAEARRPRPQN